jgi:hypothetical protein
MRVHAPKAAVVPLQIDTAFLDRADLVIALPQPPLEAR